MDERFKTPVEPNQLGTTKANNRIWFSPVWTRMASSEGEVTQLLVDHYVASERGGTGHITQKGIAVDGRP